MATVVMDLACNLRLDNHSSFRCHGNLDKVLTPTGDLATISGEMELLKQHILIWAATPLGEDIDPNCGCILHKYEFAAATTANMNLLEMELKANLKYNFPEYTITNVRVVKAYDQSTNTHGIAVSALFNTTTDVSFFTNSVQLAEMWSATRQSMGKLAYITNSKG